MKTRGGSRGNRVGREVAKFNVRRKIKKTINNRKRKR